MTRELRTLVAAPLVTSLTVPCLEGETIRVLAASILIGGTTDGDQVNVTFVKDDQQVAAGVSSPLVASTTLVRPHIGGADTGNMPDVVNVVTGVCTYKQTQTQASFALPDITFNRPVVVEAETEGGAAVQTFLILYEVFRV